MPDNEKPRGRPRGKLKPARVELRLTEAQKQRLERLAASESMSISEYVRWKLLPPE